MTGCKGNALDALGLRLDVEGLDGDHLAMLNLIYAMIENDEGGADGEEALETGITLFEELCLIHFAREESLMRKAGYPAAEMEEHIARHRAIWERIEEAEPKTAAKISNVMLDWMRDHVETDDRPFVTWMRGRGKFIEISALDQDDVERYGHDRAVISIHGVEI